MPAPRPTEAAIVRAIRAARREGCAVVEVRDGAIRIVVSADTDPVPSPKRRGDTCEEVFG